MSAPLLLVPLVTVLALLLPMSQPAQTLSIKQIFESKFFYLVFIADDHIHVGFLRYVEILIFYEGK